MKFVFNKKYLTLFLFLFLIEAYIAVYIHDEFVRPLLGDVLVILLLYAFVRTFFEVKSDKVLGLGILVFAFLIEVSQYFDLVSLLNLADSRIATTIIGTTFDWRDLAAYTIGFILILVGSVVLQGKSIPFREKKS